MARDEAPKATELTELTEFCPGEICRQTTFMRLALKKRRLLRKYLREHSVVSVNSGKLPSRPRQRTRNSIRAPSHAGRLKTQEAHCSDVEGRRWLVVLRKTIRCDEIGKQLEVLSLQLWMKALAVPGLPTF